MISTSFLIAMSVHCQTPREENKLIEEGHDWWIIRNPSTMYLKMLAWLFCNQSLHTQDREKKKLGPRGSVYLGVSVLRIESQLLWSSIGTTEGTSAWVKDNTFHEHCSKCHLPSQGLRGSVHGNWSMEGLFLRSWNQCENVYATKMFNPAELQTYFIFFFKKWVATGCLDRQQAQSLFLIFIEKVYDVLLLLFPSVLELTHPPFFKTVAPPLNWSGNVCLYLACLAKQLIWGLF